MGYPPIGRCRRDAIGSIVDVLSPSTHMHFRSSWTGDRIAVNPHRLRAEEGSVTIRVPGRTRVTVAALGLVAAVVGAAVGATDAAADTGPPSTYVVLYHAGSSTSGAAAAVNAAGGVLVASYTEIGVVIARSSNEGFAAAMKGSGAVDGVVATGSFGVRLRDDQPTDRPTSPVTAAAWGDRLSGLQWD